jgi:hypothetical protein
MNMDTDSLNSDDKPLVPFGDKWDHTNAFRDEIVDLESRKIEMFDKDGVMGIDNLNNVIRDESETS